ncbi:PilZ domain-containing protein [Clostridium sp. LP20]|uniref:PilZ domain-containing protein n=1 Tax=Clostridium sp. LP20 TaxID=3418665 RepID=UPI003EE57586
MEEYVNKRNMFRVILPLNLCGEITISRVNGKKIDSGRSYICIMDISATGIKFKSNLNFPLENVIYKVSFSLYGINYDIESMLAWKRDNDSNNYFYGVEFRQTKDETEELVKVMTKLIIDIKNSKDGAYVICKKKCRKLKKNGVVA